MPGKVVATSMFKGGPGKTTVTCNLAFFAAERGCKTLLIDLDAQGNATSTMAGHGWQSNAQQVHQAFELFESFPSPRRPLAVTTSLHLLPTKPEEPRLRLIDQLPRTTALPFRKNVRALAAQYDLILIDTPPSMNFGMEAPLIASDFALSPMIADDYSVQGAQGLLRTIERIRARENPDLKFLGFLVNRFKSVDKDQVAVLQGLRKSLGKHLIPHSLPESVPIARIQKSRAPVWRLAMSGAERKAAAAVREVGEWVLDRTLGKNFVGHTAEVAKAVAIGPDTATAAVLR